MRGMSAGAKIRRLAPPGARRVVNLGARVAAIRSELERGNAERATLYATPRWRAARRAFLKRHPVCSTAGCDTHAVVVDHVQGHQAEGWRERFWNESGWAALCLKCHAVKSRAELTAWRNAGDPGAKNPPRKRRNAGDRGGEVRGK